MSDHEREQVTAGGVLDQLPDPDPDETREHPPDGTHDTKEQKL